MVFFFSSALISPGDYSPPLVPLGIFGMSGDIVVMHSWEGAVGIW